MKGLAVIFLICLFLLAKVPPIVGMILTLCVIGLVAWVVHSIVIGAWRLVYYGGRNQRDKAR